MTAVHRHCCCCCIPADTASEHRMLERLMVEDLVHWARDYKVGLSAMCKCSTAALITCCLACTT
jgi:hypothetical protein